MPDDLMLFPDEGKIDEQPAKTTAEIARNLQIMSSIEKRIQQLEKEKNDSAIWYEDKIQKAIEQIGRFESVCKAFMEVENISKVATPKGTIYLATQKKVEWPSDATLCEWCKQVGIPILIKEVPIKAPIKEYMTVTGTKPPGYDETNQLVIRRRYGNSQSDTDEVSTNTE
jgi:hypothetical protein